MEFITSITLAAIVAFVIWGLKKDARLDDKQLQDQINTLKERVDKLESKKGSNNENR